MKKEQVELFKKVVDLCGDSTVYLYGKSLLLLYLNRDCSTIDLFIKSKHVNEETIFKLKSLSDRINVTFGKELTFDNELFTINCIYCSINDVLGKTGNIEGKHLALNDLQKKSVRFIDKENSSKNPKHILEAILLASEIEFNLEIDSMKQMFINKTVVSQLVKREIYHFLKNIYLKSVKPRKAVALINALGISMELFEVELVESAVLNNLGKKDVNEFFALIFDKIDGGQLENFLVEKAGFHMRDTEKVIQVNKLLNDISEIDATPINARKLLKVYGKDKALNFYRLFKAIGLNEIASCIKTEKNSTTCIADLCVDEEYITRVFNVDSTQAKKLLDLALDLVIMHPELNEAAKLMVALNKQKSNIA